MNEAMCSTAKWGGQAPISQTEYRPEPEFEHLLSHLAYKEYHYGLARQISLPHG